MKVQNVRDPYVNLSTLMEKNRFELMCNELDKLMISTYPVEYLPILSAYVCEIKEVMPRDKYLIWSLKAFTLENQQKM